MAIKKYTFNYDLDKAEVVFKVDTDKFKPTDAKLLLEFYTWDYDKEECPILELLKKYALIVIEVSSSENLSLFGVKQNFKHSEGLSDIDGSVGLELVSLESFEFSEDDLKVDIK